MIFYKAYSQSIEVYFKEELHRVFFPVHPTCFNLSKSTRLEIMINVKRESPHDKLSGI